MAGLKPATFAADPIHQATADPIYQAAMATSAGMSGAPLTAPPTHQEALMAPPPPQGSPVMEMVQHHQGVPVMDMVPPTTAEATMGPRMTATQLLQAVEMIARLPLPAAAPDFFDMPSGQQMTGCQQEIAGFNESIEQPYGPYIHNEIPYVDFYERSLPSNASNTLYVEGLPSNCTKRELRHLFRPFGFREVRLLNGGFDNTHVTALVEFNTPVQAFSAMETLQGYFFDEDDLYSHSLHLLFSPSDPRIGDGPSCEKYSTAFLMPMETKCRKALLFC